VGTVLPGKAND